MRISDWSSDVCSSDLRAGIGGKRCLSRTRVDQGPRYILLIACRQHLSHFPLPRCGVRDTGVKGKRIRSEEHTSELQSLMRISYAVFCLTKKKEQNTELQSLIRHSEADL